VKDGKLSFNIGGDAIELSLTGAMSKSMLESVCSVEVIEEVVASVKGLEMEEGLVDKSGLDIIAPTLEAEEDKLLGKDGEGMDLIIPKQVQPEANPPKVQLKTLPSYLAYAYIDNEGKKPVIVNANLSAKELLKLLKVLKTNSKALGYNVNDLVGIPPQVCMHRVPVRTSRTRISFMHLVSFLVFLYVPFFMHFIFTSLVLDSFVSHTRWRITTSVDI